MGDESRDLWRGLGVPGADASGRENGRTTLDESPLPGMVRKLPDTAGDLDWPASVDSTIAHVHQHGAALARDTGGSSESQESAGRAACSCDRPFPRWTDVQGSHGRGSARADRVRDRIESSPTSSPATTAPRSPSPLREEVVLRLFDEDARTNLPLPESTQTLRGLFSRHRRRCRGRPHGAQMLRESLQEAFGGLSGRG